MRSKCPKDRQVFPFQRRVFLPTDVNNPPRHTRMFAILLDSVQTAGKAEEALLSGLRSYGVEEILYEDTLGALTPDEAHSNHEDVIILNFSPDLSTLGLRRLTLSSSDCRLA
jgi:hypothetical protein